MSRGRRVDVLVVGGGTGGVAAALAACEAGCSVLVVEETDWLGGQLTSQVVPADEHPWIEEQGATASYRRMRAAVRDYYRRNYPVLPEVAADPRFNPGKGRVSRICAEPRVIAAVMDELLSVHVSRGLLDIRREHTPVAVDVDGDRIVAVTVRDDRTGAELVVEPTYVLDASELGDLLELAGVENVTGSESRADTGELHALDGPADPLDQQSFSWCFALDYRPGEDHTIDRPAEYDHWLGHRDPFWPGSRLSWWEVPRTLVPFQRMVFENKDDYGPGSDHFDLWRFRRILYRKHFEPGLFASDITLVNWQQMDYWGGPLVGVDPATRAANLEHARQLSLSFLYWMQTEAPRYDGGTGLPGLRLRGDAVGTTDGLAKFPYIRESRRIRAEFTILEQHVGTAMRAGLDGAERFGDTIGVGSYRMDLHPSTGGRGPARTYIDIDTFPFEIPLGALLPVRVDNLIAAGKGIGTTHVSNGCYRLHPVEWGIGEAAGTLAAHAIDTSVPPRAVRADGHRLKEFQRLLELRGVQLSWPEELRSKLEYY
ncbi:FAD-dependent oxidoreductase [Actinophytocola oryzae]|uniref:FAD dependent oxidoreductase n=1 Tax=Actinophytocola oryzae TaxID=502181 RepID=A0A4R7VKG9_9PSEU|nr:FAD-dependent oxidoreductase [Actinophytocola oryzae]TDV49688.1 FAD dependent oxidoreductase [Actinophytocola oryzae]